MEFQVISNRSQIGHEPSKAYLLRGDWDDYSFKTAFYLVLVRKNGEPLDIGSLKILKRNMHGGQVDVPEIFTELGPEYCSLGQDQNYYETLASFVETIYEPIFDGLRDCVHDPKIFEEFFREKGMELSLLRSVTTRNVTETFRGILRGQIPLTPFRFSYKYPYQPDVTPPPYIRLLGRAALCSPNKHSRNNRPERGWKNNIARESRYNAVPAAQRSRS